MIYVIFLNPLQFIPHFTLHVPYKCHSFQNQYNAILYAVHTKTTNYDQTICTGKIINIRQMVKFNSFKTSQILQAVNADQYTTVYVR